ncbi:relaxase/mobilization nuclease domain-containing protein [Chryseobacterium taklimakanense]|uniref:relaxase/mobilization nuclease domain-containing protein n=1 Tax=Chryseobacterium taklimakanense TaxID=536441 RepID=UPI001EF5A8B3|nr:relaxase/mobilization nuclease domain-containing protein [Chryseobacterium taklimakanense]MCG7281927.1 relaxase/mobilization nuclease domain-containing protein [Chryseobacterium taklimakanense]
MNNSATTRRISKIAVEYNGNDKGTAEMVYSNNLLSNDPELQFKEMKAIANRNKNVKNWALTGYISPEKSIGDKLSNEELTDLALKALRKVGVTDDNQIRLDIHSSTKQKHIHFIVNRVNTFGENTITAHKIGENFGKAVREVCRELNLKSDIEIGKEKKQQMYYALTISLKYAKNFEELVMKMHLKGYRVTLSQNVKDGISGMRMVRYDDINHQTERQYKPGYKLSEITNKLKIADIKSILESNYQRNEITQERMNHMQKEKEVETSQISVLKEIGKTIEEFLKPTYTTPDDDLLKRKKRKFR